MLAPTQPLFIAFFGQRNFRQRCPATHCGFLYILRSNATHGCGWGSLHAFCENNEKRIFLCDTTTAMSVIWGFDTINIKSSCIIKCNDAYPQILATKIHVLIFRWCDDGKGMLGKNMLTPMLTAHAFHLCILALASFIRKAVWSAIFWRKMIIYCSQISFTVNEWFLHFSLTFKQQNN